MPITITVPRRTVVCVLALTIAALTLVSVVGQLARLHLGYPNALGLVRLFYVDLEANVPTLFQSLQLLLCAGLLGAVGMAARRAGGRFAAHWLALALIFVVLSVDEVAGMHEATMEPMQRLLGHPSGVWAPTWVILAIPAVAFVTVAYMRFVMHLSVRDRWQILIAGVLYVGGSIGIEMLAGPFSQSLAEKEAWPYVVLTHVEEVLEPMGVLVLIDMLLRRIVAMGCVVITVSDR